MIEVSGAAAIGAALATAPTAADQPDIGAPATDSNGCVRLDTTLPVLTDWPKVLSRMPADPRDERRVAALLAAMTLEEKIGQLTQPEISAITPAEVNAYHIGSVLNGGGSWPGADKYATPAAWLALADAFWAASVTSNSATRIPVIWGIDAVHGNNNVYGATLFPHNIGLGAAHDPCLVREISAATARQIRATGQDWAFAPTLAVVRDDRWGRTYEGFSEDPAITRAYGFEAVTGLQGNDPRRIGAGGVIATAKHFLGDGGTHLGKDQGVTMAAETDMINIHAQGYYGALAAGAQTVMVSFNSWSNAELGIAEGKLHGSRYALTDILKNKMGFDGVVVSDWNGVGQVTGATNSSCAQAINAGMDVVMVPHDWKDFIANTIAQVRAGEIPVARIDDAVSRILRVKVRAGVFEQPKPSERAHAGSAQALQDRQLARAAVRKSLVLLKNNDNVLPLAADAKVLVVGKSADSMSNQTGGWSLSWQGTGNRNADFPTGTTILGGLRDALGAANVTFSEQAVEVDPAAYDAVIAVIGETPYAEGVGDLGRRSLENARLHPEDLAVLDRVSGKGAPVVTILVTGRPLWVNKELNRSAAFVVAWLPGTEGGGVADILVQGAQTGAGWTGTLSYSWPKFACQTPLNAGDEGYDPLFALGYGLRSGETGSVGHLDETAPADGCLPGTGGGAATDDLELFNRTDVAPYQSFIGSPDDWAGTPIGSDVSAAVAHPNIVVRTSEVNVQHDARRVQWTGSGPGSFYLRNPAGGTDLRSYLAAESAIVFDVIVHEPPTARTGLGLSFDRPSFAEVDVTELFRSLPVGVKATVKLPLACLDAPATLDFQNIETPFLISTDGAFTASFANVRCVPGAANDADAVSCSGL